jgi:hypothetical protein
MSVALQIAGGTDADDASPDDRDPHGVTDPVPMATGGAFIVRRRSSDEHS